MKPEPPIGSAIPNARAGAGQGHDLEPGASDQPARRRRDDDDRGGGAPASAPPRSSVTDLLERRADSAAVADRVLLRLRDRRAR